MANLTNLKQYLPEIYDGILETDIIIDVEEKIFDLFLSLKKRVVANQYLATLDEEGIIVAEKLLGVSPLPNDTLEDRRKRIIALKSTRGTNNLATILAWLDGRIGIGKYSFSLVDNHITLISYMSDSGLIGDLLRYFRNVLPLNISYEIHIDTNGNGTGTIYVGQKVLHDTQHYIKTHNIIKSETGTTVYTANSTMNDIQLDIPTHNIVNSESTASTVYTGNSVINDTEYTTE